MSLGPRAHSRTKRPHAAMSVRTSVMALMALLASLATCTDQPAATGATADLVLVGGSVYTLAWADPDGEGVPAADAPYDEATGWQPDAEAVAIAGDTILYVGTEERARALAGEGTRILDVAGGTVIPGLVDSHTHAVELGRTLTRVNLVGADTEEEAVDRVVEWAADVPPGTWIVGQGWDEGAWADRYPDMALLSERVPSHPVFLYGLHGFAGWGNRLAFERAGITGATTPPVGGEIRLDDAGEPTGLLLNRAVTLMAEVLPPPSPEEMDRYVALGLRAMAEAGFVSIHEAGVDAAMMGAFERLEARGELPIRVYAMINDRDEALARAWLERGPDMDTESMLRTRSVKAHYDGALGSRGARLLDDYADLPGHRGLSGSDYGFDEELVADLIKAGFQAAVHAIGDAGNRETLDFLDRVLREAPDARAGRHRIEHAQVVHPDDFVRFAELGVVASMEPPHAVEDMPWAEDRLGPQRVLGAYAWRTLRRQGVPVTFNSDLPGSDHDIFYGLHAAITRRNRELEPSGGWYPAQRMTAEEALRGYTSWAAYAGFVEERSGTLAPGAWADLTVLSVDPLAVGDARPEDLLDGRIVATIVAGRVVYEQEAGASR